MTTIRLDKSYEDQILELIENSQNRFIGAIQDGRTVLGGTAGSAGGVGSPPAGFWGQLAQQYVTYDTDEDAYSGGSDSLVDNLAHIRNGSALATDSIKDWHIDWGSGGSQVDAFDVPFTSTSGSISSTNVGDALEEVYAEGGGGGGLGVHDHHNSATGGSALNPATISPQTFIVGPSPCPYTTLGAAVAAVNTAGPPSAANPYIIKVMAIATAEVGVITIPPYCHVWGQGEGSIINAGANIIEMSANSSLNHAVILATMDAGTKYVVVASNAAGVKLHDVRARFTPHSSGANVGFYSGGSSNVEATHCVAEPLASSAGGSVVGFAVEDTAIALLKDCRADDTINLTHGLYDSSAGVVTTCHSVFRAKAAGDDVYVGAGATWQDIGSNYDIKNINILGTFIALPQSPIYTPYEQTNNLLTNAGHEIWQRGAGPFTAFTAYCADRWKIQEPFAIITVTREAAIKKPNSKYSSALACALNNNNADYEQNLIISDGYEHLLGQTVSLKMPVKLSIADGQTVKAYIEIDGTGGTVTWSDAHGNNTNWEDLTVSGVTVPTDATYIKIAVRLYGRAAGNPYTAYVDNCSLVLGSVAVDYQGEHPAELRERCQRYYEVSGGVLLTITVAGYQLAGGGITNIFKFTTRKAVTPTITKTGTWTVFNCDQPVIDGQSTMSHRIYTLALANGQVYFYTDSSDDLLTAEANP